MCWYREIQGLSFLFEWVLPIPNHRPQTNNVIIIVDIIYIYIPGTQMGPLVFVAIFSALFWWFLFSWTCHMPPTLLQGVGPLDCCNAPTPAASWIHDRILSWQLPSLKLTWHLKIHSWKRRFLLETIIFGFYVSFREGNISPEFFQPFWVDDFPNFLFGDRIPGGSIIW